MTIDPAFTNAIIGALASVLLAGVGYIFKTLAKQNENMVKQSHALGLLVAQVGNFNPGVLNERVDSHDIRLNNVEADVARVWAWKATLDRAGVGVERSR
jgi:hypothetical protein